MSEIKEEYCEKGCPKLLLLEEKNIGLYAILIEKIEILNIHIPEIVKIVNENKVAIATLKIDTLECSRKVDKLDNRQYEVVKEVNQVIGRKTAVSVVFSVLTLVILTITMIFTYVK